MEDTILIEERQDNTNSKYNALPYFIEIQNTGNKKMRIPCSNEEVAKNILARFNKAIASYE